MDESDHNRALVGRLREACFEIMPLKGIEKKIDQIPEGWTVAITCSPSRGIDAGIELARQLSGKNLVLIPHLAARMVKDEAHLVDILAQLDELDIHRIFVIAGDAEHPAGQFDSSLQLLRAMAYMDHRIEEIGIGAYPEGHPFVDETTLLEFLRKKEPYAAYMVTQMCFDPEVIVLWLRQMRDSGIRLPVKVGMPGVAERRKLLKVALKVGAGQSARFLKSHRRLVGKMVKPGGYSPEHLLFGLGPHIDDPTLNFAEFHIYTFNQIETTEHWREGMLDRLERHVANGEAS